LLKLYGRATRDWYQWRAQLDQASRDATAAVPNRIAFSVSPSDVNELRRWYNPPVQDDKHIPFSMRAMEYLINNGHPDDRVRELIKTVQDINNLMGDTLLHGSGDLARYLRDKAIERNKQIEKDYKQIVDVLNNFLYESMSTGHIPESDREDADVHRVIDLASSVTSSALSAVLKLPGGSEYRLTGNLILNMYLNAPEGDPNLFNTIVTTLQKKDKVSRQSGRVEAAA
jgi:hypothetical protein